MIDAQARHERQAETGRRHGEDPVVALALIDGRPVDLQLVEHAIRRHAVFAVDPRQVALPVQLFHLHAGRSRQSMARLHDDHVLLAVERQIVQPVVGRGLRQRIDGRFKLAGDQPLLELRRRGVDDLQRNPGMAQLNGGDEFEHLVRRNRAHQAEPQRRLLQANEILRLPLGLVGLTVDLLQIRLDRAAELREMRIGALAVEQRPAELFFQHLDGPRERGLADIADLSRTGEIQFVAKRQKITDLMHFHRGYPGGASPNAATDFDRIERSRRGPNRMGSNYRRGESPEQMPPPRLRCRAHAAWINSPNPH
jgi:hypothetical protein